MSISSEHPFLPPEAERSPIRRLRGRLPSPVTLWTAGSGEDRSGLTVSSLLVADGEPGYVAGVLDPLSELWDGLRGTGVAVVTLLSWQHQRLADAFGYVAPAPGGPFRLAEWTQTDWGPALQGAGGWAGCRLSDRPPVQLGWGLLVQLEVAHTEFGDEQPPLIHRRGRYLTLAPERGARAPADPQSFG
ncbi:MAG TPA: flavin reductase family protein [Jatrophihabitans sp.]|jgi:flavin reductase (DIM6/NTAB) family NADH-FMN oxidoreductase RutF|uniref:flavin reductase family protein n=1 Tax=Jatrophihabitans sp. TaxID=1932789 RepID=UPI002EF746B0